jgi:hypothetical protein
MAQYTGKDFWKVVKEIGWGTKTTDSQAVMSALLALYSPKEIDALDAFRAKGVGKLYKVVEAWEKATGQSCELGDDGFSDLLNHIVGLGHAEYKRVLDNPQLAKKRAVKYDFTESFSYCFLTYGMGQGVPNRVAELETKLGECLALLGKMHELSGLAPLGEAAVALKAALADRTGLKAKGNAITEILRPLQRNPALVSMQRDHGATSDYEDGLPVVSCPWYVCNLLSDLHGLIRGNELGLVRVEPSGEDPFLGADI